MSTILATLDSTAAARPVLETALRFAETTGAHVEAVHVTNGAQDTPATLAKRRSVPFRLIEGPVGRALLREIARPEINAAVMGARATTGGRRPVGSTTMHIIEKVSKPVVVVPPELVAPRALTKALVPLDGADESGTIEEMTLGELLGHSVELLVLHVFTDVTLPRMLDHPWRDMEVLKKEFLAKHMPQADNIEMHTGAVTPRVIETAHEQQADLIVLGWSQSVSDGRARVVREVLGASDIPVLLVPLPAREHEGSGASPAYRVTHSPLSA